jgi:hypothetical protein
MDPSRLPSKPRPLRSSLREVHEERGAEYSLGALVGLYLEMEVFDFELVLAW